MITIGSSVIFSEDFITGFNNKKTRIEIIEKRNKNKHHLKNEFILSRLLSFLYSKKVVKKAIRGHIAI